MAEREDELRGYDATVANSLPLQKSGYLKTCKICPAYSCNVIFQKSYLIFALYENQKREKRKWVWT